MFYYMMRKYRVDVLKGDPNRNIKQYRIYERIAYSIMFIGLIASIILAVLKYATCAIISYSTIFLGVLILHIFRNIGKEEKIYNEEVIFPNSKNRMKSVVKLLDYFDIDYENNDELDRLISYSENEIQRLNIGNHLKKYTSGISKYVLIPIIAILLTEYLKVDNIGELIARAFILLVISTIIVVIAYGIRFLFEDFNNYIDELRNFIRDIEQLKIFRKYEKKLRNSK